MHSSLKLVHQISITLVIATLGAFLPFFLLVDLPSPSLNKNYDLQEAYLLKRSTFFQRGG